MKYRLLGKTGLKVAEIGMGTWQLAGDPEIWVGTDKNESFKALSRYVELGGNFIDTAWVYGYDDRYPNKHPSEGLIGKYLRKSGIRDRLIIASKVPPKNMKWPAWRKYPIREVFPNKWIESCVDDSLQSLGVECIDLMQFHVWQDDFVKEDGWKKIIEKITKQGKVKFWGISINDYQPSNCLKTLDTGLISTIQFIFNIFHQRPAEILLPYAQRNKIGLIVRVPLDEGGLTDKITKRVKFPKGDFRNLYFGNDRLKELLERLDELKKSLDGEAETLSELALRYILSHKAVSTVIPGMRKVKHVKANVSVSDGRRLSGKMMEELKKHRWERNFYYHIGAYDPETRHVNYME